MQIPAITTETAGTKAIVYLAKGAVITNNSEVINKTIPVKNLSKKE